MFYPIFETYKARFKFIHMEKAVLTKIDFNILHCSAYIKQCSDSEARNNTKISFSSF
jgi:hypothetical protein